MNGYSWGTLKDFSRSRFPAAYEFLWRLRHGRKSARTEFEEIVIPEKYYRLEHIISAITGDKGLVVQTGPFAGMAYVPRPAGSAYYPKLLGSYEAELHETLEVIIRKPYDDVINVGCGEGYYAVGLALRVPHARVHAFDIDPEARRLCALLTGLNGVDARVEISGRCEQSHLRKLTRRRALIVCDCEGGEENLLRPDLVPGLRATDVLVELHDFIVSGVSRTIISRFAATHEITLLPSVGRDASAYACLDALDAEAKLLAVAEGRPEGMQWAFMTPKTRHPR